MGSYILDTNVIINLWDFQEEIFNNILSENEIIVIDKVLKELSKKEKHIYRNELVMSERFMKLVHLNYEVDDVEIENFIKDIDFDYIGDKFCYYKGKKISKIDISLIIALKKKERFILITEDLDLIEVTKKLLGENRALRINEF